jgi:CheY-like chemotaxis protein
MSDSDDSIPLAKVLIADDSKDFRWVVSELVRVLPGVGTVLEAEDGNEAVDVVRRERPRLVIMDFMMPRMDGLQATRLIKEEWPDTRVIVVTSRRGHPSEQDARRYGADAFLEKKLVSTDLSAVVRVLLP